MAKKFFIISKTGEELEVSKDLVKQSIDLGKKQLSDFIIEEGEIEEFVENEFDPNNISFGELPQGHTGASPVDIQGRQIDSGGISQLGSALGPSSSKIETTKDVGRFGGQDLELTQPTKEGELPSLGVTGTVSSKESFQRGMAVIGDSFSLPERVLGAIAAQVKGTDATILEELGDPNSSLFKGTKEKLRNSDTNGVLKFLGEAGLSIVSDPLFLASIAKTPVVAGAKGIKKGLEKRIASETSEGGLTVNQALRDQTGKIVPGGKVPDKIKGIDATPAEKLDIAGIPDEALLQREGNLRLLAKGQVETLQKTRAEAFPGRIELKRTGIDDLLQGSGDLTGKVAKNFDQELKAFDKVTNEGMLKVKRAAGTSTLIDDVTNKSIDDLNDLLPESGKILRAEKAASEKIVKKQKLRTITDLSNQELLDLGGDVLNERVKKGFFDEAGKPLSGQEVIAAKKVDEIITGLDKPKKAPAISSVDLKRNGISDVTAKEVQDAIELFRTKPTFQELRDTRKAIRAVEKGLFNPRPKDLSTLSTLRKTFTKAMEEHMESVGGQEARKLFRSVDDEFIDKVGIRTLKKTFYEDVINDSGKQVTALKKPHKIMESLLGGETATLKLSQLQKVIPEQSFDELRKAYFNSIFEKASTGTGGIISPEKLINTVEKFSKDTRLWDTLLTPEMKDVLSESVLDAFVLKNLKKFKTPQAIESSLSKTLKSAGSGGMRFALFRMFGGGKAALFQAARWMLQRSVKSGEAKRATDFFQSVDSPKLMEGLKQGTRSSLASVPKGISRSASRLNPKKKSTVTPGSAFRPEALAISGAARTGVRQLEEPTLENTPP